MHFLIEFATTGTIAKAGRRKTLSDGEIERVLAANRSFYDAFGSLDIAEMDRVWEHWDDVLCIHPSSGIIVGWPEVRQSWVNIFYNTSLMHFNITNAQVQIRGDCAWVSCHENISTVLDGRAGNFTVRATNVFVKTDGEWKMVHHHGGG